MLAFKDAFNNEDPLSKPDELQSLFTLHAALPLVLGNLAGLWPTYISWRLGCYFQAAAILASVLVSAYLYHLCQTTHECFQYRFFDTVVLDHFTATVMLGIYLLNKVNVRTVCQIARSRHILRLWPTAAKAFIGCDTAAQRCDMVTLVSECPRFHEVCRIDVDRCVCGHEMHKHFTYDEIGENTIYDSWSAASTFTIIVITVLAVVAHPFSYAAFTIVIASVILMWFIKIMLIEEGEPCNFYGRISWPELIVAIILALIGLTAYVIDSYAQYELLHSIWHVAIYLALGFDMVGTMKSVNGWRPIFKRFCCQGK